jgi:hypothetical protein
MTPMTKIASFPILLASVLCTAAGTLAPVEVLPTLNSSTATPLAEPLQPGLDTTLLMRAADHRKLGGYFAACIEARKAREGKGDAEEELREYLDKKWMKASKGRGSLALSDDLAAGLWHSFNYTKKMKGLKKGKVAKFDVSAPYYGENYVANNMVWLPKKYDPKKSYPLILCLPDVDEKPADHLNDYWSLGDLRDNAIVVALDMPEDVSLWGSLGESDSAAKAGGQGILLSTFGEARDNFAIDFDRVYLAGRGAGVAAAMEIANGFPDRFCGIIGRTGDAAEMSPANLSNIPCFFAGGGKNATAFQKAATDAKYAECTLNPSGKIEDVWAWVQSTTRTSHPEKVTLHPGNPFPTKAYWVGLPRMEYGESAQLTAKVDRASNTITVEATGVQAITIFLNDTMVDMDKPVKVVLNGTQHEDLIPRNFYSMIEQVYTSKNDPGKFYTASMDYDIPAAK